MALDQERARALGITSAQVAKFLESSLSGSLVSTYREDNELFGMSLGKEIAGISFGMDLAYRHDPGLAEPMNEPHFQQLMQNTARAAASRR